MHTAVIVQAAQLSLSGFEPLRFASWFEGLQRESEPLFSCGGTNMIIMPNSTITPIDAKSNPGNHGGPLGVGLRGPYKSHTVFPNSLLG
jgi:hypothetical protein